MTRKNFSLLVWLFLITSLALHDPTRFVDSQTTSCTWPQASDLPLQPVTTLSNINCEFFNVTTLLPSSGKSLVISDSIITNTVIFPTNFSLHNASIKFINTKLRVIRQRDNRYMLLLPGASLEFHNCTIIPPNEHQRARWFCDASTCYTLYFDSEYYAQGLQLMIGRNSAEYDIIIKGCTYRFVSDNKSFLLNASTMSYGFGIEIETAFDDNMFNYSFRNIEIVDNHFETNHGAMDFFLLQFNVSSAVNKRRMTGNMINISGNSVVMRQIEGNDLMLVRESYDSHHVVLGPQIDAALQLRSMLLNDNNIDVRGVTLQSDASLLIFTQGFRWDSVNFEVKQLSVCRNKVVMSPTFSNELYRGLNSSNKSDPAWAVHLVRFLSIRGLNHVDEMIMNDNDVFMTTGAASAFYLSFATLRQWFLNGKEQLVGSTSANIGNVTISRNKVECRDTLDSSMIYVACFGSCEHFGSFIISHNNFSTFLDQKNSNFTNFLNHDFRAVSYWGFIFSGSSADSAMRDVGRISTVYNTIHLEGSPRTQGFLSDISFQECKFLEYSFNKVTLIQDDRKDRSLTANIDPTFFSYGRVVRMTQNVLRISKLEIQQNVFLLISKAGSNELVGIDITTAFDPRTRNSAEVNPSVVPIEFKDRPELVYKNASIWNNTMKILKIGSQSVELLVSPVRVGSNNQSIDIGYFYIFNNSLVSLTNTPSPATGMNGITIATSGYSRNFSAAIISNNKIRVSGASGIVSGISLQTMDAVDASSMFTTGAFYVGDGDTRNFKKMVVENNDIQVSNLKGTVAAINFLGAGVFQVENLELRNNTVLLTSRSLTEFFGSDPYFAPYSSFAGIDTVKVTSFPQDQHSYFYALCPYGKALGFFNIETRNGLAVSVGKMTIENEKITLEKSGSFFSTRLGFYISDSLNVRNINMKSLGIADSSFRPSVVSSIFNIDSSSLGFQGLEYFTSVFPRIAKISVINSIFSIQLPSSCGDILNSNDKSIINNQLSFINILPAPSTTVATTIVGDLIIQNVSFTQDCSAGSNLPSSISSSNNIINIPKATTTNTRTSINVTELNIFSLPNTNFFLSESGGNLISSTSTSSSSTSATTAASIYCTSWNGNIVNARSVSVKSVAAEFVSSPSLLQVRCNNDFNILHSQTQSIASTISGNFETATRSVSEAVWRPYVANTAAAEKAVAVAQVATILSGNPALSLAVSRSAVLFRLASCYVNQKDLSPEKLALRFEGHSTKILSTDIDFPLSLIPGARVGTNHVGSSYRGGLVIYIVVFFLVAIVVLFLGRLNRDTWQKHQRKIVDANRNVSRKPEKRDPAFGLGPFWKHAPIDRGILLPFSFVAPFWCEVAGGLATGAPNGASDAVLALLPIILFCIFVIYAGKCVFEFTSSQQKKLSSEPQSRKNKDKRPIDAEVKNPQNFMVESELYISRALLTEKPARATMRERLISPVGRFMFIGNHCWATNPALIFHEDEASTLNLDELEDVAIEMLSARAKEVAIRSKKFASLFPPSPSLRMTPRYGQAEWLPMSGIATQFGGWLRALQLPLKIKSEQLSPQTRRREHRVPQFDFSLRSRLQLVWLAITLSVTIIVCCIDGAATVDPSKCHASFFVVLVLCVVDLILLAWLRPFVVPFKTVSNLIIDSGTVIGGLILLSCVVSIDRAETLVDTMSAGMMMCALPGSILGPIALILFIVRMGCVVIFCKATVVPKTKLQELRIRMRGESNNINNNRDSSRMRHFGDELLLQPPEEVHRSPRNRAQFRESGETNRHHHHQRHRESSSSSSTFDSHRRHGAPSSGAMRPSHNHSDSYHRREMLMARSSRENNEQNDRKPNTLNNDNNNFKSPFSSYREPQGFLKGLF